jgi:LysR family nod box-dependent transcriptional activator
MHFKNLDLNLLVGLDALLAQKNVTRAAERLHLSQSATSGVLARLRDFFNDELLVQVGHEMILTPLADGLVDPVRNILLQVESLMATNPAFSPEKTTRSFRLMMSDYVATVLMPEVLRRAQLVAPALTVEILSNAERSIEALDRGEIDLLIAPKQYISSIHPSVELFRDQYVCMISSENQPVNGRISLERYLESGHVAVRLGEQSIVAIDELFLERAGYKRRVEVGAMAFNLLPQLVIGTTRIATVPAALARIYVKSLPLRIFQPPIEMPQLVECMQWHKYRDLDPGGMWLRQILRDVARDLETRE